MRGKTQKRCGKIIARVAFVVYLMVLTYFLFFSERYGRAGAQIYRYNLVPFREIRRYIQYRHLFGWEYFVVNIYGNILAFVPFGFFLPIVSKSNRSFWTVTLYGFEFTLGIELVQLSFQVGTFDVDDIIMNTLGAILGYILFALFKKKLKKVM